MARNIVVCCDGTSNQFARSNTNVVKLYQGLVQDPERQLTYYHPGLGTLEAVGALTSVGRRITKLLGLAMGYGLEEEVLKAYHFVARSYVTGDSLFLFGFSRGAYTARAVASLLHAVGILRPDHDDLAKFALRLLSARSEPARTGSSSKAPDFALLHDFKRTFSVAPCPIHFVGVWDTVSSVGWFANPFSLPYTRTNPSIAVGRHAVSIDERRAFFRTNLWSSRPNDAADDIKQVWFPGDHCDVGGGHPPGETGHSDVALAWMVREAAIAGLLVNMGPGVGEGASTALHESLTGWWRLAEFLPKPHWDFDTGKQEWRMNLFRRRTMPDDAFVHESALDVDRRPRQTPLRGEGTPLDASRNQREAGVSIGADRDPGFSLDLTAFTAE